VGRQLSQVDNSMEEEVVTPVQIAANGLDHHQVQETSVVTQQTVQTSSSISVTEMKSETFARQDTFTVETSAFSQSDTDSVQSEITVEDKNITESDNGNVEDDKSEGVEENQKEILSDGNDEAVEEEEDEVDEANLTSSGLQRQNTYTVRTVEVKESSSEVMERFSETQKLVEYKYEEEVEEKVEEEVEEEPLYREPDEDLAAEESVEVKKVVEDQYVTAEEVRTQKHRTLNTVTEVTSREEPTIMEETSLASLNHQESEDGLERTSRDVDPLLDTLISLILKDIRDPNLDCSLEDIEAMIDGKDVKEMKEETTNRGSPEFAKAAALIDQNPDKGFDPDDPAVKGLEDWECSNLTTSFDTEESKPSKLKNVFKRMSRTEETRSLLNESLNNNNFEKEREDEDDNFSPGCFGTTLLYIFLKIFD